MAKHWSAEVYVLCYYSIEPDKSLRMRCKWSANRNALARAAAEMPDKCEPILYNGFGNRLPLSVVADDDKPAPKAKAKKPKGRKRPAAVAA